MTFVRRDRLRGWWYPWIFVGGFAVVLLVNIALLFFATLTFNGFETREASDKRNAYNDAIQAAEIQSRLGWEGRFDLTVQSSLSNGTGRRVLLNLDFSDQEHRPLEDLSVRAVFRRPVQEGLDFSIPLSSAGSGLYTAVVDFPLRGVWEARIVATKDTAVWRMMKRIDIR